MNIKSILAIIAVITASVATFALVTLTTNVKIISAVESGSGSNNTSITTTSAAKKVHSGGGNSTGPLTVFIPENIQIKNGESVTWDNPTSVGEPHTVTFVLDNKTNTGLVSPFAVPNSTRFTTIPPNSNNEPLKVPGKDNVVIGINARSFIPTLIDSQGSVKHFAPPNAAYTMNGSEKYVNSGWLLPKGQEQGFPGAGNTFTVTFQKAGTYNYICQLHPWMRGSVTVK
jgi:plastocyanin